MTRYKGYIIWWNDLQRRWLVQCGYEIVYSAPTMAGAKRWITITENKLNREIQ